MPQRLNRIAPLFVAVAAALAQPAHAAPSITQAIPPPSNLLAACQYLEEGDIPVATFEPPTNTLFVATAAGGGSDANNGLTIDTPFEHLDKAVQYANTNPATPFTIYLRGGVHTYKRSPAYYYLEIERGNLYVTAWSNETATVRPHSWPNDPTEWGDEHAFVFRGPFTNITFAGLTLEGWANTFYFGSSLATPPMSNVVLCNITAREFRHRNGDPAYLRTFADTDILLDDVYGAGKNMATNWDSATYQVHNVIIENCRISDLEMAVNFGDENDANIKSLRISNVHVSNPTNAAGETSAQDGFAVVNCYKVLIDHCRIENIADDGIDTKSEDVSVVNCFVTGTGRNAVKFWLSGEIINSILYDCTPINDGAMIFEAGPGRMVHTLLMKKSPGYAGTFDYDDPGDINQEPFEIINCAFAELGNPFFYGTTNFSARNNLFDGQQTALFDHPSGQVVDVSQLNAMTGCSNNVTALPQLLAAAATNFWPGYGSGCIDAGTSNAPLLPVFDYYGRPRSVGTAPDIGPIEYDPSVVDSDADGLSDGEEAVCGTTPTNALDVFRIENSRLSGTLPVFSWNGVSGRVYDVFLSTNRSVSWPDTVPETAYPGNDAAISFTNDSPQPAATIRIRARLD